MSSPDQVQASASTMSVPQSDDSPPSSPISQSLQGPVDATTAPSNQSQIQPHQQQQHQAANQQPQQHPPSQIPPYRALSRHNSNTSTTSSNRGELGSSISTAYSRTSSRSQLSKQLFDHSQLLTACGTSTPIRSFQRATISSVVKTRAFDKDPVLQGLLTPTGKDSNSPNSPTPPPPNHPTTPLFSRSRSLRMSGGPNRYHQPHSPSHHLYGRTSSRTPDLHSSYNSCDMSMNYQQHGANNESQMAKLAELTTEKLELKESLEFLECERQVLIDTTQELKDTLNDERLAKRRELEDLKKQLTDQIALRVKAESLLTRNEVEMNDMEQQIKRLTNEISASNKSSDDMRHEIERLRKELDDQLALNEQLKQMLDEKLKYNGLIAAGVTGTGGRSLGEPDTEYVSIVTEMARLRLELNEKDKIIEQLSSAGCSCSTAAAAAAAPAQKSLSSNYCQLADIPGTRDQLLLLGKSTSGGATAGKNATDMDALNRFLDQTVECMRGWPDELAGSDHVQNLMKTLLSAYRVDEDQLALSMAEQNIR